MTGNDIRRKYIEFFVKRGHTEIPSASLVPLNDPTTLFTSSGMQPLVPYLLGQPHPAGKRIVDSQKSFRSQDIEEVGDNRHTTFFEMLGNWSFGDYFKKEQLPWFFEFLTQEIGLDPKRLYVTVFSGEAGSGSAREGEPVPKDTQSIEIWKEIFKSVGIEAEVGARIFTYNARKNWWSRSGEPENMPAGEPGGPDSEVFFDFGQHLKLHENSVFKNEKCHPNCDCGRFLEIGNSVFMQYQKQKDGTLKELAQKNVDFGGGLERIAAAANDDPDVFKTDFFVPVIAVLESLSHKKYTENPHITRAMRIIADHIRGSVMMMADGVLPSNKTQGYILRRLIRRSLLHGRTLGLIGNWMYVAKLVTPIATVYQEAYPDVVAKAPEIALILEEEALRFGKSLEKGMREIEKVERLDGTKAFNLYETYGFPWEMTEEIARDRGQKVEKGEFEVAFKKHQDLSRTAAKGMFKGGLADHSEQTTRLHTAHHLLLAALQKIVDPTIKQRGSNITAQRLRIDLSFGRKFEADELQKVTDLVNQKIKEKLPVVRIEMKREDAEKLGAQMEFGAKYPDLVSVYLIGLKEGVNPMSARIRDFFSAEFCGGPHVDNTGVIGVFKIIKEESAASGIRRIYATLAS